MADMSTDNEVETLARQLAAFDILSDIYQREVNFRNVDGALTAREQHIWTSYGNGHSAALERMHALGIRRPLVLSRRQELLDDRSFRMEIFDRYFSPTFAAHAETYFPQAKGGQMPRSQERGFFSRCGPSFLRWVPWYRQPCQVFRVLDQPGMLSDEREAELENMLARIGGRIGSDIVIDVIEPVTDRAQLRRTIDVRYEVTARMMRLAPASHIVIFVTANNSFLTVRASGMARNELLRTDLIASEQFREIQIASLANAEEALAIYLGALDRISTRPRGLNWQTGTENWSDALVGSGASTLVDDAMGMTVLSDNDVYRVALLAPALQAWLVVRTLIPNAVVALIAYLLIGLVLASAASFALGKALAWPRWEGRLLGLPLRITLGNVLGFIATILIITPLTGAAITASFGQVENVYEIFAAVGWPEPTGEELARAGSYFVRLPPSGALTLVFALLLALPPLNAAIRWEPAAGLAPTQQQELAKRLPTLQFMAVLSPVYLLQRNSLFTLRPDQATLDQKPFSVALGASLLLPILTFVQASLLIGLLPAGLALLLVIGSARAWATGLLPALKHNRDLARALAQAKLASLFQFPRL